MNAVDALRLFRACGAKKAVPYHMGMFDELTADVLETEEKLVLEIYQEQEV